MPDEMTVHRVERPDCGHMQEIFARKAFNIADYNTRLVPELQEKLQTEPCTECEKLNAEKARKKLEEEAKLKGKP